MFSDYKERYAAVGIPESKADWVNRIKFLAVKLEETLCEKEFVGEAARLKSIAVTHLETACMFAVKAISRQ